MSNKVNHRRQGQRRRSENATFGGPPCGNARDKAKGRRKWKNRRRRSLRRNGYESRKVHGHGRPYPAFQLDLEEAPEVEAPRLGAQRGRNSGRRSPSGRKWRVWQRKLARRLRRKP
ncbi:MAG: hypothetical protein GWN58_32890 [Anaerolineae bacterium]|nr:hypothetical protein [Thermoplasmata archaeon]NIV34072.1 hypothetical protein [Anaerolineae bacterium]NIY05923.1 hypothetical protein [Thermoplasmata archaeon]